MGDWIAILAEPIPVGAALEFVADPGAGGIDVFLGITRGERNAAGLELVALEYEAYTPMAEEQLRNLAQRARAQWPIVKLALLHRTGRVALGQASVLIAVSTPHRSDCFAACRFLIDTLKAEAAIWKKEIWADGAETWKQPT